MERVYVVIGELREMTSEVHVLRSEGDAVERAIEISREHDKLGVDSGVLFFTSPLERKRGRC